MKNVLESIGNRENHIDDRIIKFEDRNPEII